MYSTSLDESELCVIRQADRREIRHVSDTSTLGGPEPLVAPGEPTQLADVFVDEDGNCLHGMVPEWCGICGGLDRRSQYAPERNHGFGGGVSKQDLLDDLCRKLDIPRVELGEGSSIPSRVFKIAAKKVDVPEGSMPEIGEAITTKAGLTWTPECDSRDSKSAGGSTVTREGPEVMVQGLGKLLEEKELCVTCFTALGDGEGFDGMCWDCADEATSE